MRVNVLRGALGLILATWASVASATDVTGALLGDATWGPQGNPWMLTGDVTVPPDVTLTIAAGAEIRFTIADDQDGSYTNKVELRIEGALEVNGAPGAPVNMTSASNIPARGAWEGIVLAPGAMADITELQIAWAVNGLKALEDVDDTTILIMTDSEIRESSGRGLWAEDGVSTEIIGGAFNHNAIEGIFLNDGTHGVSDAILYGNGGSGLYALLQDEDSTFLGDGLSAFHNVWAGVRISRASERSIGELHNSLMAWNPRGLSCSGGVFPAVNDYNGYYANSRGDFTEGAIDGAHHTTGNPLPVDHEDSANLRITHRSPARGVGSAGQDLGALPFIHDQTIGLLGKLDADLTLGAGQIHAVIGDLIVPAGVTLTIANNAELRLGTGDLLGAGQDITRTEIIIAGGTLITPDDAAQPAILEGGAVPPINGNWYGVVFTDGGPHTLNNMVLRHGYNPVTVLANQRVTLRDTQIIDCSDNGVLTFDGAVIDAERVAISGCTDGLELADGQHRIARSQIFRNRSYGVFATSDLADSTLDLDHLTVFANSQGIYLNRVHVGAQMTLTDLIVTHNGSWGIIGAGQGITARRALVWDNANGTRDLSNVIVEDTWIRENPLFVDEDNNDLRLTHRSPARGQAAEGGDLGAFTFDGAVWPYLNGILRADLTLTVADSPWYIPGDLVVPAGVTLTVEPGATVNFGPGDMSEGGEDRARTELIVFGALVAGGTPEAPITFGSANQVPLAGDWYGVRFEPGSDGHTLRHTSLSHAYNPVVVRTDADLNLSHLQVERFTQRGFSFEGTGEVRLTDSFIGWGTRGVSTDDADLNDVPDGRPVNVTVARTVVRNMSGYAVYPLVSHPDASATFDHVTLWLNTYGAYIRRDNTEAVVHISNSVVAKNGSWGVHSAGVNPPTLDHNDVWGNANNTRNYTAVAADEGSISADPLFVSDDDLRPTANSPVRAAGGDASDIGAFPFDGAPTVGIVGILHNDTTFTAADSPWIVSGDVIVPPGVTLTIEPGATVKFGPGDQIGTGEDRARTELIVFGTLVAEGTAEAPITLLGTAAIPIAGDWYGVRFEPGSDGHVFTHVNLIDGYNPVVVRTDADLELTHLFINRFTQRGISVEGEGQVRVADSFIGYGTRGIGTDDRDLNDIPDGRAVNLLVERTVIRNMSGYGLYPLVSHPDASAVFDHVTVWRNTYGAYIRRDSAGAVVEIADSIIASSGSWGVHNAGALIPLLSHNNVWENANNTRNFTAVTPGEGAISTNPLFVSDDDLELTANSPARGAASDGSDIGAHPFDGVLTDSLVGVLRGDLTLTEADSPWNVTGDFIVPAGTTLTIEPGAVVTFGPDDLAKSGEDRARAELIVFGTLNAEGTADDVITLNAATGVPIAGHWYGVRLEPGSAGHSLRHLTLLNGYNPLVVRTDADLDLTNLRLERFTQRGASFEGEGRVRLADSLIGWGTRGIGTDDRDLNDVPDGRAVNLLVERTVVHDMSGYGVYPFANHADASAVFDHVTLWHNTYGAYIRYDNAGAEVRIVDSVISSNGSWGVHNAGVLQPTITGCNIWDNANNGRNTTGLPADFTYLSTNPLMVDPENGDFALTHRSPSRFAADDGTDQGAVPFAGAQTVLLAGYIHEDLTLTLEDAPYVLSGDLTVLPGRNLTIEAGVEVRVSPVADLMKANQERTRTEIIVQGAMHLDGQRGDRVRLISDRHIPARGDWSGVRFEGPTLGSRIAFADIYHTTRALKHEAVTALSVSELDIQECSLGGVLVTEAAGPFEMTRCTVGHFADKGVWIYNQHAQITSTVFHDGVIGLRVDADDIHAQVEVINNTFQRMTSRGVEVDKTVEDAQVLVANNLFSQTGTYALYSLSTWDPVVRYNAAHPMPLFSGVDAPGDTNILLGDVPGFVNADETDLHLTEESLVLDRGDAEVAPARDRDGRPRSLPSVEGQAARPDLGAYEFDYGAPIFFDLIPERIQQGETVQAVLLGVTLPDDLGVTISGLGVSVANVEWIDATRVSLLITADAFAVTGPRDVIGTYGNGGTTDGLGLLTVVSGPAITSVTPPQITQGTRELLTIRGRGFQLGLGLVFGPGLRQLGAPSVVDSTTIRVSVEADEGALPGGRDITLTNADSGNVVSQDAIIIVRSVPLPQVAAIAPNGAIRGAQGLELTVTGQHFQPDARVFLSGPGLLLAPARFIDAQTLAVRLDVAADAPIGVRDVTVVNADGGADTLNAAFAIETGLAVEAVSPDRVLPGDVGVVVSVSGQDFTDDVVFNFVAPGPGPGVAVTDRVRLGSTRVLLTLSVPDDAVTGAYNLVAQRGGEQATGVNVLEVGAAGIMRVDSASPAALPQGAQAVEITIRGANMPPLLAADFGAGVTVIATGSLGASAVLATVNVAADAPIGPRDIQLSFGDDPQAPSQQTTAVGLFEIIAGPRLLSLTPNTVGQGATGFVTEVRGDGFVAGATVRLTDAGVTIQEQVMLNAATIRLVLNVAPDAPLGAQAVTLTNPDGGGATLADGLVVVSAPIASAVAPNSAFAGDEVRVTVTVADGRPGATLRLSGEFVTVVDAVTAQGVLQATLRISAQAEPGLRDVTVINPDGGSSTLADAFTVLPIPMVTRITPNRVQRGDLEGTLVLTGAHFMDGAEVLFIEGGVQVVAVTFIDAETLEVAVQVTEDATLGFQSVVVTNPDGGVSTAVPLLHVDPAGLVRLLEARPEALFFFAAAADRPVPPAQDLSLTFTAPPEGAWTARASQPWIELSMTEGDTPTAVQVSINPALTGVDVGALSGEVVIVSEGHEIYIPISLEMLEGEIYDVRREEEARLENPVLSVTPRQFDVNVAFGDAAQPQALQVRITDDSRQDWIVISDSAWVRVSPVGGRTPTIAEVNFDIAELTPRALPYRATLRVTAPALVAAEGPEAGERVVEVRLFVRDPAIAPTLVVSPERIQLGAQVGGPAPLPVPLSVRAEPNGAFAYDAEVIAGGGWLSLTNANGVSPGVVAVHADPEGLNPDDSPFEGIVRVTLDGDDAPIDVPVTFYLGVSPPTAEAGDPQQTAPTVVILDASGSAGEDEITAWTWTVVEAPEGADVSLDDAEVAQPSALLRAAGLYVFEVTVTDSEGRESLPDRVRVTILDVPPMADAGVGLDWRLDGDHRAITLRGARSDDANGDALAHEWRQLAGPAVVLSDAFVAEPTAEITEAGLYRFELTVNDASGQPDVATVTHVVHRADLHLPSAYVTGPSRVRVGELAQLDGTGSIDTDGDALVFAWQQVDGEPIQLDDPLAATPAFPALLSGRYGFTLSVADDAHPGRTAQAWLLVDQPDDRVPTAIPGETQSVVVGERVTLSAGSSIDPPNDPEGAQLSASWTFERGLRAPLSVGDAANDAQFLPVTAGVYTIQLEVFDGRHRSVPAFTQVVVDEADGNHLPRAEGALASATIVGEPIELDASGVDDLDGDALSARWRQVAGPALGLDDPEALVAHGTPLRPGLYAFMLSLDDGRHRGPEARIEVVVEDRANEAPIADAGKDEMLADTGAEVVLDGSDSSDPDGDPLTYQWTLVQAPVVVELPEASDEPTARFIARISGIYVFELVVNDGRIDSAPFILTVIVREGDGAGPRPGDVDGDGIDDADEEALGLDPNSDDSDGDGIPDNAELALDEDGNPLDTDGDGVINALDEDDDGDGIPSIVEGSTDDDRDGIPNYLDDDDDGDGVLSIDEGQEDTDGDGVDDYLDTDDDGDGEATAIELERGDTDLDGTPDYLDDDDDGDSVPSASERPRGDTDGDGTPDHLDIDDDGDTVDTAEEAPRGDTDADGTPDFLDPDDDGDGTSTRREVGEGDVDGDGVPDYLDEDQPPAPIDPDSGVSDNDAGPEPTADGGVEPDTGSPSSDGGCTVADAPPAVSVLLLIAALALRPRRRRDDA